MSRKTTYEYFEPGGILRFKTVRTDKEDGSKAFAQFHRERAGDEWIAKAPPWPRPVFGLDQLSMLEDGDPVLVVEGEKTALAARQIFGNKLTVVTWSGGVNAVEKTDWKPLKRFRVAVWPDLDRHVFPEGHANAGQVKPFMMQEGTKAASRVVGLAGGALVNIPDQFIGDASWVTPDGGWDLADELPAEWSYGDCGTWIRAAFEALEPQALPPALLGTAQAPPATESERSNGTHVPAVDDDSWRDRIQLIANANGTAKPLFENACKMLEVSDRFGLVFDEFQQQIYCTINGREVAVEDEHVLMMARWVQQEGVHASPKMVEAAVLAVAQFRRRHPPREYLQGLKWDGIERCEMWLIDNAGVEDTELSRAISKKFLIQATARIMRPGCQADVMMILEGVQGIRKSSLLRTLFGTKWFADHLPNLETKDALQQLLGTWCIEVAELSTLAKAESAKIKAFISSPVDKFRLPYGRFAKGFPRSCVFAGTSNDKNYLRDFTGGRRFWPIECTGKINIDAVALMRDQLWAEAVARFDRGEPWWMEDHLEEAARAAQDERREDDPWEPVIAEHLVGKAMVESRHILKGALGIAVGDQTQLDKNRVAKILTLMKWERTQRRVDGLRSWVYTPKPY